MGVHVPSRATAASGDTMDGSRKRVLKSVTTLEGTHRDDIMAAGWVGVAAWLGVD
jgi:hypothetical protein